MAGVTLGPLPTVPLRLAETSAVDGVQEPVAPRQVSRTKTSLTAFVSFGTRFVATDWKATNLPSQLITGLVLSPSASVPSLATETRMVEGVQAVDTPRQVSRTKMSILPFISPLTRLVADDWNTTKRPATSPGVTTRRHAWISTAPIAFASVICKRNAHRRGSTVTGGAQAGIAQKNVGFAIGIAWHEVVSSRIEHRRSASRVHHEVVPCRCVCQG